MHYSAQQISGQDGKGGYVLAVVVKSTYHILETGICVKDDAPPSLNSDLLFYPGSIDLLDEDIDLLHTKLYTDVVVKGNAHINYLVPRFPIEVQIGNYRTSILAIGPRKAYLNLHGNIAFTEPEMIKEVPLRYDYAYGGRDSVAEAKLPPPPEEYTKHLPPDVDLYAGSPYRYPRNPSGKGYLVEMNHSALEQMELPNLEDPDDLLSPSRLVVGQPENWESMPLPRCTDWINPTWFPRIAYTGLPYPTVKSTKDLAELTRKWVEPNIFDIKPMTGMFHFRAANGASLGFQLPYLQVGTKCQLINIHPIYPKFSFNLPSDIPSIWVDGRQGKLKETSPVIQSVIINLDQSRLSIVWRGSAPAIRPYFEEELKTMPFKVQWN